MGAPPSYDAPESSERQRIVAPFALGDIHLDSVLAQVCVEQPAANGEAANAPLLRQIRQGETQLALGTAVGQRICSDKQAQRGVYLQSAV